mmetsp:Transcript_31666/g.39411  ORF Transcript_31666/g.39411 Transcript_31666/m.39411 type:complete len:87 (+) Transcript_31666:446-706(+)
MIVLVSPSIHAISDKEATNGGEYQFLITCDQKNHVYPWRFLYLYVLDVLSAVTDLFIFICIPKTAGKKDRLRATRVADIENNYAQH